MGAVTSRARKQPAYLDTEVVRVVAWIAAGHTFPVFAKNCVFKRRIICGSLDFSEIQAEVAELKATGRVINTTKMAEIPDPVTPPAALPYATDRSTIEAMNKKKRSIITTLLSQRQKDMRRTPVTVNEQTARSGCAATQSLNEPDELTSKNMETALSTVRRVDKIPASTRKTRNDVKLCFPMQLPYSIICKC